MSPASLPRPRLHPLACTLALAIGTFARPAASIEGVVGINQIQALTGGVTPGDAPGFPVTISTPGSFILTGNLSVGSLATTAILVTASSSVALDLNGFTIRGACPAVGGCAAGAGSSIGIDARSSTGMRVRNGRVRNFAADGVAAGSNARIAGIAVEGNGGAGIAVASGSEVSDCLAYDNAGSGIAASQSIIRSCNVATNLDGIVVGSGSLVAGNAVVDNDRLGIAVNDVGTTVRANVVSLNSADGIAVTAGGSLVVDNVAFGNASAGIALLTSGSVRRNLAFNNAIGMYLFPEAGGNPAAYRGNVVNLNTLTSVTSGVDLGENSCNGNATCP